MNEIQPRAIFLDCPPEIGFKIFKNLSLSEQKVMSMVSKYWYNLFICNDFHQEKLDKVYASVKQLLQDSDLLTLTRLFPNTCFDPPKPDPDKLIYTFITENIRFFDCGKNYNAVLKDEVDSCEIGIPRVHIWKALPPHNFVIVTSIFIGMCGKPKNLPENLPTTICFFSPSENIPYESDPSNKIKVPIANIQSTTVGQYFFSANTTLIPINLNAKSQFEINFYLSTAFHEIGELCRNRIEAINVQESIKAKDQD